MSDYLGRIIARSMGREKVIQPRLGSIFEPQKSASWRIYELIGHEDQVSEPRTSRESASSWISPNAEPSEKPPKTFDPMPIGERFISSKSSIYNSGSESYEAITSPPSTIQSLPDEIDTPRETLIKGQQDFVVPAMGKKTASYSRRTKSILNHEDDKGNHDSRFNDPYSEISSDGIKEEITGTMKRSIPMARDVSEAKASLTVERKRAKPLIPIAISRESDDPLTEERKTLKPSIPIAKDGSEAEAPLTAGGKQIGPLIPIANDSSEAKASLTIEEKRTKPLIPIAHDSSEAKVPLIAKEKGTRHLKTVQFEMPVTARAVPSSNSYPESTQMTRNSSSLEPNQKVPIALHGRKITAIESKPNLNSTSFALKPSYGRSRKPEQAIQVTIGKVEVRGVPTPSQAKRQSSEPAVTSLEEYLNRRARRFER